MSAFGQHGIYIHWASTILVEALSDRTNDILIDEELILKYVRNFAGAIFYLLNSANLLTSNALAL